MTQPRDLETVAEAIQTCQDDVSDLAGPADREDQPGWASLLEEAYGALNDARDLVLQAIEEKKRKAGDTS